MAQQYSKQQLRDIFQSPFNQEAWKAILHNLFRAEMIRKKPEKFTAEDDNEDGFYLGALDTSDSFRIGLFYFVIKTGSVAHKKVGLRNLVKEFVNPTWGEFDAAIVVFDDKKEWRLSFVCDIKDVKTTPKRYTFVFGEHDNFYRTAIERFLTIQNSEPTFENIRKAFSVDALSDDFFDTYREYYADFVQYITGKRYVKEGNKWVERELGTPNFQYTTTFDRDDKLVRDYVKKMFGRIVFLYFLQRKGWLNGDRQYMHNLFYGSTAKDNFLDGVLEPLFFEVLNTDKQYRTADANALPGSENIPYLNGGLFARDEIDEPDCVFPEDYFQKLFDFLDSYNFTIDENDVDDAEIGIDPEMLGRIFENLLEDNKDKGAFYTPKEIVNYMCRESLIAYLQNGLPERSHELIRNFVENCDASQLNAKQIYFLRKKLQEVKICDPAIGSGAFPMGLVNILSRLYIAMKADTDTSKMKRHIIENNIYGVDIEKGAVDIARLRFWLAMIVEEKEPMPLPNLHFKIMQGNSLLESVNSIDLSDLTRTNVDRSLLDSTYTERKNLKTALSQYYNTSNHADRDRLFNEIINNVRRQIYAKDPNIDQIGLDPSANDKFFLWHTWFADVFDKGGFDIVIANPPYIDSETMTNLGLEWEREYITQHYSYISGNWDIYMAFLELATNLSNKIVCYITPDKWLSKPFGKLFREKCMTKRLSKIVHAGSDVFENATVDAIITLFIESSSDVIAYVFNSNKYFEQRGHAIWKAIESPYYIDSLFSPFCGLVSQIESCANAKLSDFANCEGACATSDAYKLVPLVSDLTDGAGNYYKLVNTGTLDKFANKWGNRPIKYLGVSSINPIVLTTEFESAFGKSYINKSRGPKIIIKGLNLLDAYVDENGEYLPGKSTLVINSYNVNDLHLLSAFLNSDVTIFFIKTKYSSSSYCGGITFTKEMINNFPIPSISEEIKNRLIALSKKAHSERSLSYDANIDNEILRINIIIYHLYNLKYDEVLIINPATNITREEYENFEY